MVVVGGRGASKDHEAKVTSASGELCGHGPWKKFRILGL